MSRAETTRSYILQKSFDLIYQKGYQATSIDEIIATTQVTKGAFFYHFKNKEEMGLALINELMYPHMIPLLGNHLKKPGDVRTNIYKMMKGLLFENDFFKVEYGCPTVNLIEEMAPQNEAFRKALTRVIVLWQTEIEMAIIKAQEHDLLNKDLVPGKISQYVTASYAGARYMGKMFGKSSYTVFLQEFKRYLNNLN
ncbi:TetR/AcrR family transcriptional regulator [Mucilaginibacter sp. cycad4]|uniref:TetR/AcrR family transcriptional regulator n=1 Tax=Mucilaginibacter sp. cycad4 TaxID=3342096 RepID=UPI002AAA72E0|nr:TetR/AcrR family transcriptional regulator [Mucilaginibacter gossypii]WPU99054.1 TetR/AcrR family transcriptional regulator [Mucilaginibacter gossypii]